MNDAAAPAPGTADAPQAGPAIKQAPARRGIACWLVDLPAKAWFAYSTIFLLQLHAIWKIWLFRDLTSGDTSVYFWRAWRWHTIHRMDIVWSPLYCIFYGSLMSLSENIYFVTMAHRMIIVLATALLVLAVTRRMLPPGIAWLTAAWWVLLPVNYDAMYEVHQFSILPILVIWLVALRPNPGRWTRGFVLALMIVNAVLVRNEFIVPLGGFVLYCIYVEWRARKMPLPKRFRHGLTIAYGVPTLIASLCIVWAYFHTFLNNHDIVQELHVKHTLNMAQVYAFGYQQRHPEWTLSPWTDFGSLCISKFGTDQPDLLIMLRHDPRAVFEHFWWNAQLTPSGLQVLLFNNASGSVDPDYGPVHLHAKMAIYLSAAVLAVLLIGAWLAWRERRRWRIFFASRKLGWVTILLMATVAPFIILSQRPRPEYLYNFSILIMICVGTAVWIILSRFVIPRWLGTVAMLCIMAGLFAIRPLYHKPNHQLLLADTVEQLKPFQSLIDRKDVRFLKGAYADETCNYVGHGNPVPLTYPQIFPEQRIDETLAELLDRFQIGLVYLDETGMAEIVRQRPDALREFLDDGGKDGWVLRGYERNPEKTWMFFQKTGGRPVFGRALTLPREGPFSGWFGSTGIGPSEGPFPQMHLPIIRWAYAPQATLQIGGRRGGVYHLVASLYGGVKNQQMTIELDGKRIDQRTLSVPAKFEQIDVPLTMTPGRHTLTLRFGSYAVAADNAHLAALFRQLQIIEPPAK